MGNALAVIGCAIGGGFAGSAIGFVMGEREGGDFNLAPAIYAPIGAAVGGFVGVVVGALVFAK